MAAQIETHFKKSFSNTIRLAAQQMESKLMKVWQFEPVEGEEKYFDTYSSVSLSARTSRNAPNNYQEAPRGRRMIANQHFEYSELFDKRDLPSLMKAMEPDSQFQRMVIAACRRKLDETLIDAFDGDAATGKAGGTTTSWDSTNQDIAHDFTTDVNLTLGKLREARHILEADNVDLEGQPTYLVCHPTCFYNGLMADTNATSQDFVTHRPHQTGHLPFIMGMEVILSNLVPTCDCSSTDDGYYAYVVVPSSGVWGWNRDLEVNIDTIADRGHATQLAVYCDFAATRMFENQMVRIECEV